MSNRPKRLYYVDWLRVSAMLTIFIFHADRFFDNHGWHVKNDTTNLFSSLYTAFFSLWIMPLFFVLSGASIYYSLQSRSAGAFLRERVARLLIPLVTIGYFVIAPPQSYLDRVTNADYSGSFIDFFPRYFDGFDMFGGNFAWHGFHLWYLLFLFVYSIILLPLFVKNRSDGKSILVRLAERLERPGIFLLLVIPVFLTDILVDIAGMAWARGTGGWSLLTYIFYLMYGYLFFSNQAVLEIITKIRGVLLFTALIGTIFILSVYFGIKPVLSEKTPLLYLGLMFIRAVCSCAWILVIIGFSEKFFNFENDFLHYANRAVLPFYILHQLVLLVIGYFVVQWNVNDFVKFLVIAFLSFWIIMAVYELLIRRQPILRFLFGMKR